MGKKKNSRQGFTLIELLATVLIMSLLIGIVLFSSIGIKKESEIKLDKVTRQHILSATKGFVLEYRNKESSWKEDADSNGNVSFCVSLNSLLETGYYKQDDKYIIDNADKLFVYTKIDENKVSEYKIISTEREINNLCGFEKFNSNLNNNKGEVVIKNDDENKNVGNFEYEVSKDKDEKNAYEVDIKFLAELGEDVVNVNTPVYVAILLDNSGSMIPGGDETNWVNARDAAIELSNEIYKLGESYVALVQYSSSPVVSRDFKHAPLEDADFRQPVGESNVSGALDLAISLYKKLMLEKPSDIKDAQFYTIILYDGEPKRISYLENKNKKIYNSSPEVYYQNFYDAYTGVSTNYKYIEANNSSSTYIENAAEYLKNNGINSKLITVGYGGFSNNSLKRLSSKDNEFCKDGYRDEDITSKEMTIEVGGKLEFEGKDIEIGNIVNNQISYNFEEKKDGANNTYLKSTNTRSNTQAYGYYELDLESEAESNFAVKFNYEISGGGFLRIYITSNEEPPKSKNSQKYCSSNEEKSWIVNSYCDSNTGSNNTEIVLKGSKKYYIHLYFHNDSGSDASVKFNDISYRVDDVLEPLEGNVITLSTEEDSRLVYPATNENGKWKLASDNSNSYSASYQKINLKEKDGKYLLTVNVTLKSGNGYIGLSKNEMPLFAPIKDNSFLSDNRKNSCNTDTNRCLVSTIENADFNFVLNGGTIHYVHYLSSGNDGLIINNISLIKISDSSNTIDFSSIDTITIDNIKYLKTSEPIVPAKSFKYENGSFISQLNEIHNSCSHGYFKLNISATEDTPKILEFNSLVSSEHMWDIGNIIISRSSTLPNVNANSDRICDMKGEQGCVEYISGSPDGRFRYWKLNATGTYYIHFMYCKDSTNYAGSDSFKINKLNIYDGNDVTSLLGEMKSYSNYFFEQKDEKLLTSIKVGNTVAHSYLKINLEDKNENDRFLINMDTSISGEGKGLIILTEDEHMPSIDDLENYSNNQILFNSEDSNKNTNDISKTLSGKDTYYLHLMYHKEKDDHNYDGLFAINSIEIFNKRKESEISLLGNGVKSELSNGSFEKSEDGKIVSNNQGINASASAYFTIDLKKYPSDKKFKLFINSTLDNTNGINRIIVNKSFGIPFEHACGADCESISKNSDDSFDLYGNQVYYVHVLNENNRSVNQLTINSIRLEAYTVETQDDLYCYYSSKAGGFVELFMNLSTIITNNVKNLSAEKARLTLSAVNYKGISFNIVDSAGKIKEEIVKEITLKADENNKFEFNDRYKLVLNDVNAEDVCDGKTSCNLDIRLFDVKLELIYSNKSPKVITIPDLPTITINYKIGEAIN